MNNTRVRQANDEAIRRASKELLGSSDRLQVAAAVARRESDLVYARELARQLNLPDGVVSRELKKFAAAGILRRMDRLTGNQPAYFERARSPYWDLTSALLDDLTRMQSGL